MSWVNIWQDPEAAAFVASLRDGYETVPTAVDASGKLLDSTPKAIRNAIAKS